MLMILARLVRSESFWAVVKVRSPHTGPEVSYPRTCTHSPWCKPPLPNSFTSVSYTHLTLPTIYSV